MKNKDDPRKGLRRYNQLRREECRLLAHLESIGYADQDKVKEMVEIQQKRAKEGRKLNIGLIQ